LEDGTPDRRPFLDHLPDEPQFISAIRAALGKAKRRLPSHHGCESMPLPLSQKDQHEQTQKRQEDLEKCTDMIPACGAESLDFVIL
jgi:hypothetical protein